MTDLTLKEIKKMKYELEDSILQLIRDFELGTNVGIEKIDLNLTYQLGYSNSMVVSVDTKLGI